MSEIDDLRAEATALDERAEKVRLRDRIAELSAFVKENMSDAEIDDRARDRDMLRGATEEQVAAYMNYGDSSHRSWARIEIRRRHSLGEWRELRMHGEFTERDRLRADAARKADEKAKEEREASRPIVVSAGQSRPGAFWKGVLA